MFENELKNKIEFVNEISTALTIGCRNIDRAEYVIFQSDKNPEWYTEFVVMHYRGGAIQARYCTGNSCGAIFEEIAQMLYTSQKFPQDTRDYLEFVKRNSKILQL